MESYTYKGTIYELFTGPKGGKYILLNNKKHYIKTAKLKSKKEEIHHLSYYVPDPEHEGDIDYALHEMDKIGDYKLEHISREFTDDGEEIVEACIYFTCKDDVYPQFKEFCKL